MCTATNVSRKAPESSSRSNTALAIASKEETNYSINKCPLKNPKILDHMHSTRLSESGEAGMMGLGIY